MQKKENETHTQKIGVDTNPRMMQMLQLADKDFKATFITMLRDVCL